MSRPPARRILNQARLRIRSSSRSEFSCRTVMACVSEQLQVAARWRAVSGALQGSTGCPFTLAKGPSLSGTTRFLRRLDALVQGDATIDHRAERYGGRLLRIGLVKFPPTLLIAGNVTLSCGAGAVTTARPYVGLAPAAIAAAQVDGDSIRFLLTVENLTTFHKLAGRRPVGAIMLYTGGMPSPSWKRVYGHFLAALPQRATVHHWGDIDVGGFRIASHITKCCEDAGRLLRLHGMRADTSATVAWRELVAFRAARDSAHL